MRKVLIFSLFIICGFSVFPQATHSEEEVSVYDLLFLGNKLNSQKEVVDKYRSEVRKYQRHISKTQADIDMYNKKIKLYKNVYGKLLVYFYFVSRQYDSRNVFLLSSRSFSSFFKRYNYFRLLVRYMKNLSKFISLNIEYLEKTQSVYRNYSHLLEEAMEVYENETLEYVNLEAEFENSVGVLQQNTDVLRSIIERDYAKYRIIDRSVNVSEVREARVSEGGFNPVLPLSEPIIVSSFGKHDHPYLKHVKIFNDGIDIYSKTDTLVKCIADGKIKAIVEVPDFGYSVVVQHKGGVYYSVYSNVDSVYVSLNEDVKSYDVLGHLSADVSRYSFACLNIQIWENTKKLNPQQFFSL